VITNENIKDLRDVSQLCTKQVGTGEMIKYKRELKNRGNREVKLKRNDNKVFMNPLKVDLTVIGSLRCVFVLHHDTTVLT